MTGKKNHSGSYSQRGRSFGSHTLQNLSLTSVVCKQLERVLAGYLRQVWDKNDWFYERQQGFRPGYSCESQVISVCQDIADSLEEGVSKDAIIIDFPKSFDLVPHDRLLMKLAASGVDLRVVIWIREFLVGRTQRVRVGGQLSKEAKVTSGVPQGSVLGTLLFLVYVNNVWRNIDSSVRFFADDCIIYRKITNKNDIEKLQKDLNTLGGVDGVQIQPSKFKAIRFTIARVKIPLGYSLCDQKIPEASSCKCLGIIIRSDLKWVD